MRLREVHKSGSDDLFRPFMWQDRMFEAYLGREGGRVTSVARRSYFQLHQKLFNMYLYMTLYAAYIYSELGGDLSRFTVDGVSGTYDWRLYMESMLMNSCAKQRAWGCGGAFNSRAPISECSGSKKGCNYRQRMLDIERRPTLHNDTGFVDAYSRFAFAIAISIDRAKNLGYTGRVCQRPTDYCELDDWFKSEGYYLFADRVCNRWRDNHDRWCKQCGACP